MHIAAIKGFVGAVDVLLDKGAAAVDAVCEGGETALALAVQGGHGDVVERLLEAR